MQRFGPRSVVMIARAKSSPPRRRQALAASATPRPTASIASGTPIVPVSATATRAGVEAERLGGRVAHRERVAVALLAGGGVGVARS